MSTKTLVTDCARDRGNFEPASTASVVFEQPPQQKSKSVTVPRSMSYNSGLDVKNIARSDSQERMPKNGGNQRSNEDRPRSKGGRRNDRPGSRGRDRDGRNDQNNERGGDRLERSNSRGGDRNIEGDGHNNDRGPQRNRGGRYRDGGGNSESRNPRREGGKNFYDTPPPKPGFSMGTRQQPRAGGGELKRSNSAAPPGARPPRRDEQKAREYVWQPETN